jgi:hypothetical protein
MSYRPPPQGWQPNPAGPTGRTPYGYGRPPQKPQTSNGFAIAAVAIIGTVLCVLTLAFAVMGVVIVDRALIDVGDAPDKVMDERSAQILRDDLDVELGNFVPAGKPLLETGKLPVILRNKGRDTASFSVHVEAVDAAGNRIADDTAYAANLFPGQSITDDLFIFVPTIRYDAMSRATVRIVEASKY